ncbi:MAG: bifunctional folylpolyglutamate synthase/dihydrofolate synthase [Phycisphaerales bacterium]
MGRTPPRHGRPRTASNDAALPGRLAEIKLPRTYAEAVRLLNHLPNLEVLRPDHIDPEAFKLGRMRALLDQLEDPHTRYTVVHVAGSKGKGSICEMLAAALRGCGYATGLHTSPHLVDVRERVRINGDLVSQEDFTRLFVRVLQAGIVVQPEFGTLTYFEAVVAMAFAHFAEQAVDAAVIEVGLGGRLDATNVVTPAVSLIAEIQLEHTQILGDTLALIAGEKAGICKPGVPAITLEQEASAMETIERIAGEVGAPLSVLGRQIEFSTRFEADPDRGPHHRIGITTEHTVYEHIAVPLPGEHQARNAGLVLAALAQLTARGFDLPEIGVASGLDRVRRMGRLERVWDTPRIVVDGAHTPDSVRALVSTLGAHERFDSMIAVFGCAEDKDTDGMLIEIARGADKVVFTRSAANPRACDPAKLAKRFAELTGRMAQVEPTVRDAVNTASRAMSREDLMCITGSFYIAGEAKRLFEHKRSEQPAGA